jgi:preprotein translocase subunit SecG
MQTALAILHVFVCLFMILVILLQAGKSGGIGGLGSGGGASSVFGGRGSQTILGKITTVSAALFMITSLTLAYFSSRSDSMVLQRRRVADEKVVPPADTAAPAPGAPAEGAPTEGAPAEGAAPSGESPSPAPAPQ